MLKRKPRPALGTRLLAVPPKLTGRAGPNGPLLSGRLAVALVTEGVRRNLLSFSAPGSRIHSAFRRTGSHLPPALCTLKKTYSFRSSLYKITVVLL